MSYGPRNNRSQKVFHSRNVPQTNAELYSGKLSDSPQVDSRGFGISVRFELASPAPKAGIQEVPSLGFADHVSKRPLPLSLYRIRSGWVTTGALKSDNKMSTIAEYMSRRSTYEIVAYGDVQKVGYRRQVERLARRIDVKGYVKNQPDGTVKILAQGVDHKIQEFVKVLKIREAPIDVQDIKARPVKTRHVFKIFRTIPGSVVEELQEGLGSGEEQLRLVRQEIGGVRQEISSGFATMDNKYGEIAETLKELRADFSRLVEALESFLKGRSHESS